MSLAIKSTALARWAAAEEAAFGCLGPLRPEEESGSENSPGTHPSRVSKSGITLRCDGGELAADLPSLGSIQHLSRFLKLRDPA